MTARAPAWIETRERSVFTPDRVAAWKALSQRLDGLVGVVQGDEQRVRGAMRELSQDTLPICRHATRSLGGLWLNRTDPNRAADTLKAVSDDVMRTVGYVLSVEAVDRLVVARGLRRRGQSAEAERYHVAGRESQFPNQRWNCVGHECHHRVRARECIRCRGQPDCGDRALSQIPAQLRSALRQRIARWSTRQRRRLSALEKPDAAKPKSAPR